MIPRSDPFFIILSLVLMVSSGCHKVAPQAAKKGVPIVVEKGATKELLKEIGLEVFKEIGKEELMELAKKHLGESKDTKSMYEGLPGGLKPTGASGFGDPIQRQNPAALNPNFRKDVDAFLNPKKSGLGGGFDSPLTPLPKANIDSATGGNWNFLEPHPWVPHIHKAILDGYWEPDPGYQWVDGPIPWWKKEFLGTNLRVQWQPGKLHDLYRNVVASSSEGHWNPAPGFVWNSDQLTDHTVRPVNVEDR